MLAAGSGGDPGALRDQIGAARAREQSLSGQVGRLTELIGAVERQLAVLQRRRAQVEADLAADRVKLAGLQVALRAERARLTRLRARLAVVRRTLARQLLAAYEAPQPDLVTVALTSRTFSDLIENVAFARRVQRASARILDIVRAARADAARQSRRLAADEDRQRRLVVATQMRRNVLAGLEQAAASRQAALQSARAARVAALQATRANRAHLEHRLAAVEAAIARAAAASTPFGGGGLGPSAGWAIPWAIVNCESGGQNLPPNGAGASGYYQILPDTWRLYGGPGPAAYKASKAAQDAVAARIWDGGRGASAWVCAGIVGIGG
jgi:hypothetical protein